MAEKPKQDVKQEVEQRLREIALLKEETQQQGLAFSSLSEEELSRKIKSASSGSPYVYAQAWISGTSPGSSASYTVYIANPDAVGYYPMFVSIFFGAANFLDSAGIGEALADGNFNMDTGWPYMSTRPFSLAAGATTNQSFSYTTPTGVPLTTYIGNSVVWRGQYHDQGVYFDRGLFYVTLL
jgi:hypothetical protein